MPRSLASPHQCPQCGERAGIGVLEWAPITWWRRLTRRAPAVLVHAHFHDRAEYDAELCKMMTQIMMRRKYPR
jgi:hypothetical protein